MKNPFALAALAAIMKKAPVAQFTEPTNKQPQRRSKAVDKGDRLTVRHFGSMGAPGWKRRDGKPAGFTGK